MAKNKKTKKIANKVSVGQTVKALKTGYGSKATKPVLAFTGMSRDGLLVNGESGAESGQNEVRPENDCIDHSLIREPLNLGVKNVQQILHCVKESTLEVKDLILNECNIIYECKICLNLFRSLANFIAHKRIYCKTHFCERMVLFDSTHLTFNDDEEDNCNEDDNELEDEEQTHEEMPTIDRMTGTGLEIQSALSSGTNSLTENINPNEEQRVVEKKRNFIEKCVKKVENEKEKEDNCNQLELQLTSIKSNPNAVFQSIRTMEVNDDSNQNIKSVNKKQIIDQLFKEAKNSRQLSDSESQSIKRQRIEEILPRNDCESDVNGSNGNNSNESLGNEPLKCDICDSTFTSTKTLRVHIKTIHSSNRLVYPCPLCSLAFKQVSNATRHLIQIHKRTKTQANTLKEVMKRRAYSTNSSENSSEVEDVSEEDNEEGVQTEFESKDCENKTKMSESCKSAERQTPRINSSCAYNCGNWFDWPPAKRSHEKSCRKRWEIEKEFNTTPVQETNGSSHSTVLSQNYKHSSKRESTVESEPDLSPVPMSGPNPTTNLILPNSVEEKIKEFADYKSLRCTLCPSQDFMNLNQLLQHAVTHIGYSIYKCHGCSYHSIYENDMKYHLMNNHNINEDMIGKHYQTLPNLTQPRLLILPIKSSKAANGPNSSAERETDSQSGDKNSKLKIHLRTMSNTSKKCYEIVDK